MLYQKLIHEIEPSVNPAGVEASMRLIYGVLDHLSRETFAEEIQIAKKAEAQDPGFLRQVAESYGMEKDFLSWEESTDTPDHPANATVPPPVVITVRCSDCTFWKKEIPTSHLFDQPQGPYEGFGQCSMFLSEDGTPENKNTLAYAIDRESYTAIALTSPDFGCLQGQFKR